ncbi:MAG: hypothetical protein ACJ75B_07160 [Flavisolibacter sp.]
MFSEISKELVTLIIGVFLGGLVKSALDYRSKVFSLLWDKRMEAYQDLVKLLSRFPKWPRAEPVYSDLLHMSIDLKNWYFDTGGILMSKSTRLAFENLQIYITGLHELHKNSHAEKIQDEYNAVVDLCHLVRVEMTRDLLSRKKQI